MSQPKETDGETSSQNSVARSSLRSRIGKGINYQEKIEEVKRINNEYAKAML